MEFLPRTLLFYILSHVYLFWRFYRLSGRKRVFLFTLPAFAAMGMFPFVYHLLPAGTVQELFGRAGTLWLPPAFFCLIVFVIADALSMVALLFRRVFPSGILLFFSRKRYLALLLLIAAGLYAYGVYEAHSLRITTLHIPTEKLPAGTDKLRIVFASDLHIGPQTGTTMLGRTVDMILAQQPDMILLGGDLLDDSFQGTPGDVRELRRLQAPLGVYTVLGNHDTFGGYHNAVRTIKYAGLTLLSDETVDAGPIRLVGLDDPLVTLQKGVPSADISTLLRRAQSAPPERFIILLDHRPEIRRDTVGLFDLQLSGHSHGGQLIMLKALLESKYGTPTGFSEYQSPVGRSVLFVTTGTGFSKLPIRLFVPPEIVVIDITRREAQ